MCHNGQKESMKDPSCAAELLRDYSSSSPPLLPPLLSSLLSSSLRCTGQPVSDKVFRRFVNLRRADCSVQAW